MKKFRLFSLLASVAAPLVSLNCASGVEGGDPSSDTGSTEGGAGDSSSGDSGGQGGGHQETSEGASTEGSSTEGGSFGGGHPEGAELAFQGAPLPGYTLITSPENDAGAGAVAFLVDMEGAVVHEWSITGFPAKMLPGGEVIGCTGVTPEFYDCARMEQRTWDDELVWSFNGWTEIQDRSFARQHHDFVREGSSVGYWAPGQAYQSVGTTWVLGMYDTTAPEVRPGTIVDDVIYQVDSEGKLGDVLFRGLDHWFDFGFDEAALEEFATKPGSKIELLHGNTLVRLGENHWYDEGHEEFHPDNLIYSSRHTAVSIVLSHSTGEIVWKIGPDFGSGPEASLGQFVGPHFVHMIPKGLPGAGNILVFDNGGGSGYGGSEAEPHGPRYRRNYSRVVEFDPVSFEIVWEYARPDDPGFFYSAILGSAQRLPNGNTVATLGLRGQVHEITPEGEIVWSYQAPHDGTNDSSNWVYRGLRVPPEWLPAAENATHGAYEAWEDLY